MDPRPKFPFDLLVVFIAFFALGMSVFWLGLWQGVVVSNNARRIRGAPGEACKSKSDCVSNSECKMADGETTGVCACLAGCAYDHASNCCQYKLLRKCEPGMNECNVEGFACVRGVCRCDTFGPYGFGRKKCLVLGGSVCDPELEEDACIWDAFCWKDPNSNSTFGLGYCKCKEGFELTDEFYCNEKLRSE